jgi:hypothetical protein
VCNAQLECECPPPGFVCWSLLYGEQCCLESQQCDQLFGCWW